MKYECFECKEKFTLDNDKEVGYYPFCGSDVIIIHELS